MANEGEEELRALELMLDRGTAIESLSALARSASSANHQPAAHAWPPEPVALGLDANVVLKLADKTNTDVVDYLGAGHLGPLVLPGQVIQEFWNNRFGGHESAADAIRNRHKGLAEEVKKLDPEFVDFHDRFEALLDQFESEHAFAFDTAWAGRVSAVIEVLQKKAIVSYVPRSRFYAIAEVRDRTRTPPGFRDPGKHGDFFVWADFLHGLQLLAARGQAYSAAVFVTEDGKLDWSQRGRPHPLLVAEAEGLLKVPFDLWDLGRLSQYALARSQVDATAAAP
jgi:hypothetical protein